MRKYRTFLASLGVAASILAQSGLAASAQDASAPSVAEIQRIQQRNATLLDAHLAAMKAGLALNDDQATKWASFETAIRDAAKARSERWLQARERMTSGERPSPLERISILADHLEHDATELRNVAVAGKPLYDSLDDRQKRRFGPLMQEFRPKKRL